ncbi:hypothetical protein ABE66_19410 [Cytobacillus firmus]|nr:hypothetical protein [Cytobacillus firmus]
MILENADAFPSCGVYPRKLIQCPAGGEGSVRPRRRSRGGSHSSPRKASAWSGNQRTKLKAKNNNLYEKSKNLKSGE